VWTKEGTGALGRDGMSESHREWEFRRDRTLFGSTNVRVTETRAVPPPIHHTTLASLPILVNTGTTRTVARYLSVDNTLLSSPTNQTMTTKEGDDSMLKSALRDNIERKGKNAYYFAHANKPNGPEWDGKPEPRLLSRQESQEGHQVSKNSTFEYYKSNINKYAFLDDGNKVKLYIDLEGVGDKCVDEDIQLDFTENSLCLVVKNYAPEPQILSFAKLTANINKASFRRKEHRIILSLVKEKEGEWHTINDKGTADHEVV